MNIIKCQVSTLIILGIIFGIGVILYSCSPIQSSDIPQSAKWISIKTGLTDTSKGPGKDISTEEYAEFLNNKGFEVTWSGVEDADYYEIRVSNQYITTENWAYAALAGKIRNTGDEQISTTLSKLQPIIKGNNCTGCENCVFTCPNKAISIFRKKAIIDLNKCTGCAQCYDTCIYNAVTNSFLGHFYYFAVRSYSKTGTPSEAVTCSDDLYMLRYYNSRFKRIDTTIIGTLDSVKWCGHCYFQGCYINNPKTNGKGCPAGALYEGEKGFIIIDQLKCMFCGYCLKQCGSGGGNWSIRKEVVAFSQYNKHQRL